MRSYHLAFAFTWTIQAVSLWDPTGPYHVGYTQHIFDHITPNDTTKPGTFMLATIYYPTRQIPNTTFPYIDPVTAGIFEENIGLTPGIMANLTTRLQFQAPTLIGTHPSFGNGTSPYPTLVFTPGAGLPTSSYTAYLSELASYGYAVVAIDHPGEAPYLALPYTNGTGGVYGNPDFSNYPSTIEEALSIIAFRLSDVLAAMSDSFFPALVRQYGAPFNTTHFGIFGHSIGGAGAGSLLASKAEGVERFKIGVNLDGTWLQYLDENATIPDIKTPFLEVASEVHFEGNTTASEDYTWKRFDDAQSGWLRDVQVNGTIHLDFSDFPLWIDLLNQRGTVNDKRTWIGPANGIRTTQVTNALLREVFASIQGTGLGGVDEWIEKAPEVFLLDKNDP
ncbi:hypothetical protein IQ07DRAFT_253020 [Pyrenochaeta sp. DS3sAY3a]|nr:hypothetical protein IQ07DRAFT_253020 [Pyrenochaeta sp. DS3sAY3a]